MLRMKELLKDQKCSVERFEPENAPIQAECCSNCIMIPIFRYRFTKYCLYSKKCIIKIGKASMLHTNFLVLLHELPIYTFYSKYTITKKNEAISFASKRSIKVFLRSPGHKNNWERNGMILTFWREKELKQAIKNLLLKIV